MTSPKNILNRNAKYNDDHPLIYTVKNLCRVCYTCVRECPVKAIKIINGQAEVIPERCIACGNCVQVCSQGAKTYHRSGSEVKELILNKFKTVACIAPSFPAEFSEFADPMHIVGMLRKLGFDYVTEVSFGADIVAKKYEELFDNEEAKRVITSDCPAIVLYIEKYHPDLVNYLASVDSPAMAMAKVIKKIHGEDIKTVFIGPCIAKKTESEEFDASITFSELRQMFFEEGITHENSEVSEFDPPHSGKGAIFPVNHGLIKSIDKSEDIGEGKVLTAEGKNKFKEAVEEFENGILKNQHLELLCCDGCIQGPGMSVKGNLLKKRFHINEYVNKKIENIDLEKWNRDLKEFYITDLNRTFIPSDKRLLKPDQSKVDEIHRSMGKFEDGDFLNCGACGYETCQAYAEAVVDGLAEPEMCLPYAIEKLHKSVEELNVSNLKLADTKQALIQSEKLASMGQVSAGIAHELNNPLGIITLYSSILKDDIDEESRSFEDIRIIEEQAERCRSIVGGLLNFARKNQVKLTDTKLIKFLNKCIRSIVIPDNVQVEIINELEDDLVKIDKEQMIQAITNILKNAVEAMPVGGFLKITAEENENQVKIMICDTGVGIEKENLEKIFTPFFTTKEIGKGTGLGLPLVYGIIKMHKGKVNVKSNTDKTKGEAGTCFMITLPK